MKIILDAAGKILMYSENGDPASGSGQVSVFLKGDQVVAFKEAMKTSNDALVFDGSAFKAVPKIMVTPAVKTLVEQILASPADLAALKQALGL